MTTETAATRRRTATFRLPLVTAELHAPHVPRPHAPHVGVPHVALPHLSMPTLPGRREVADLGRGVSGLLPPKDQLALYGGLGAAAALGVLDWPVAVAVAAGTAVARRGTLRGPFTDVARALGSPPRRSATTKKTPAKKATATKTTGRANRRAARGQAAGRTAAD